eukprot:Gb_29568 [translate_table: standard]
MAILSPTNLEQLTPFVESSAPNFAEGIFCRPLPAVAWSRLFGASGNFEGRDLVCNNECFNVCAANSRCRRSVLNAKTEKSEEFSRVTYRIRVKYIFCISFAQLEVEDCTLALRLREALQIAWNEQNRFFFHSLRVRYSERIRDRERRTFNTAIFLRHIKHFYLRERAPLPKYKMKLKRFQRSAPNVYAIIAGVFLVSFVFVGLFLWGLVKRHKKSKAKASSQVTSDKITGNNDGKKLVLPTSTFLPPDSWNVCINDLIFDPETDYAQVLAEAQKYVSQPKFSSQAETAALSTSARLSNGCNDYSHTSKSRQTKVDNVAAQEIKPSKGSWKNSWLFKWQHSKRGSDAICSASPTPAHRGLKRSVSGPLVSYSNLRRGNSGPIYTDGIPLGPSNRSNRSSGTRSGSATPDRTGHLQSPYEPLKSSARLTYGPLYTV